MEDGERVFEIAWTRVMGARKIDTGYDGYLSLWANSITSLVTLSIFSPLPLRPGLVQLLNLCNTEESRAYLDFKLDYADLYISWIISIFDFLKIFLKMIFSC